MATAPPWGDPNDNYIKEVCQDIWRSLKEHPRVARNAALGATALSTLILGATTIGQRVPAVNTTLLTSPCIGPAYEFLSTNVPVGLGALGAAVSAIVGAAVWVSPGGRANR